MQRPASAAWVWWHLSAATPVVAIHRDHRTHRLLSGTLKHQKMRVSTFFSYPAAFDLKKVYVLCYPVCQTNGHVISLSCIRPV